MDLPTSGRWGGLMDKTRLIIFAREPQEGRVKTRLLKSGLPGAFVTSLYKVFVKDVLKAAQGVTCSSKVIYYAGTNGIPFFKKIGHHFERNKQQGKDLGERMKRAFKESRRDGFDKTVLIGTDT